MKIGRMVGISVVVLLLVFILLNSFTIVQSGFTGVPVTFGKVADYTVGEGPHFHSPFTDIIKMDNHV